MFILTVTVPKWKNVVRRINCCGIIIGKPEADVSWAKDGKKIDLKKKKDKRIKTDWDVLNDTFLLEILNANTDDAGDYTVTAKNAQGEVSQTVKVNVEPKKEAPKVKDAPKPVSVVEGNDVDFGCKVTGQFCLMHQKSMLDSLFNFRIKIFWF